MHTFALQPDFDAWRTAAREALTAGYRPGQVDFQDASVPQAATLALTPDDPPSVPPNLRPHVPKAFLDAAQIAATHRDPERWNLLYRLLFRLQTDRNLLRLEVDDDVAQLKRLESQVRRDLHKMHAFVRFRKVDAGADELPIQAAIDSPGPVADPAVDPAVDPAHYIAWYRPDHRILPLAAPFFAERFAPMRWTILTPDASVSHDPAPADPAQRLTFGPGAPREHAPEADELEDLWRSYYGSIFNPARLNPTAMKSEMPVRYWANLPEIDLLPQLLQKAESRVATMVTRQSQQSTATPFVPTEHSLPVLAAALPRCEGCELYKHAIQVVPGVGSSVASLMLVGEQPGDQEDKQGAPFVGPAGGVLRRALEEVGIDPEEVFMTNAVKHFKYVQRGRLRLHQNPRMSEINACRPWLQAEIEAVHPKVILCLGASAAKSLLGGTFALMKERGQLKSNAYADRIMATVHPSAVLRAQDPPTHDMLYSYLKDDLALAHGLATGKL